MSAADPAKRGFFGDCSARSSCPALGIAVVHATPERKPALGADVASQVLEGTCVRRRLENLLFPRKRQGFGM
jgi:hypothetical protein